MDNNGWIRKVPEWKRNDASDFETVTVNSTNPNVRAAAALQVYDQNILARLAMSDRSRTVRCAALENLTSKEPLSKIAIDDEDLGLSLMAVKKVNDQYLLAEISSKTRYRDVRFQAVLQMSEEKLLTHLIAYGKPDIRSVAVGKLTNQHLIAKCTTGYFATEIRIAAINLLLDHRKLAELAKNANDTKVRYEAKMRLERLKK